MNWPFVRRQELEQLRSKLNSLEKEISEYQISSKKQKDEIVRLKKLKTDLESKIKKLSHSVKQDPTRLTPFRLDNVMMPSIPPSYTIFKKGNYYFAQPCKHGLERFFGSDASSVIKSALNALTSGRVWKEKVILKGNFELTDSLSIPSYSILEIQGKLKLMDNINKDIITISGDPIEYVEIYGGYLDGNKANQISGNGIYINKGVGIRLFNIECRNVKDSALKIEGTATRSSTDTQVSVFKAMDCGRGIHIASYAWDSIFGNIIIGRADNEGWLIEASSLQAEATHIYEADIGLKVGDVANIHFHNLLIDKCNKHGIECDRTSDSTFIQGQLYRNSWESPGSYDAIYAHGVSGNHAFRLTFGLFRIRHDTGKTHRYGVNLEPPYESENIVFGNNITETDTPIRFSASDWVFKNKGFITENYGTASGPSPITIPQTTHLLDIDPTFVNAISKTSGQYVISVSYDSITKEITIEHSGGTSSINVFWEAKA